MACYGGGGGQHGIRFFIQYFNKNRGKNGGTVFGGTQYSEGGRQFYKLIKNQLSSRPGPSCLSLLSVVGFFSSIVLKQGLFSHVHQFSNLALIMCSFLLVQAVIQYLILF